jgi:nicotinamide-nucleotide amidase
MTGGMTGRPGGIPATLSDLPSGEPEFPRTLLDQEFPDLEQELRAGEHRNREQCAQKVLDLAGAAGLTLAVAESLTGGRLAAALTGRPGASAVFRGSVTAYATDLKASILGVDPELLAREGAVHGEVARQMAEGVRRVCGSDLGVATTGVAGPTPQDGKEVGTVYLAVADSHTSNVVLCRFSGDRSTIQDSAVGAALNLTLSHLKS